MSALLFLLPFILFDAEFVKTLLDCDEAAWQRLGNETVLPEQDTKTFAELADKLARFVPRSVLAENVTDALPPKQGEVVRLEGKVGYVSKHEGTVPVFCCHVILNDGRLAHIFTPSVPQAWKRPDLGLDMWRAPRDDRIAAYGVYVKSCYPLLKLTTEEYLEFVQNPNNDIHKEHVFVAPAIEWFPDTWLGNIGFDVGSLDQVPVSRVVGIEENDEETNRRMFTFTEWDSEPFYGLLRAVSATPEGWLEEEAKKQHAEIPFGVTDLFNRPAETRGKPILLRGTAKRIVPTPVQDSEVPSLFGIDHYYQIYLFTEESRGNPIVVCVRSLPEGMPVGDANDFTETITVAAVPYKLWIYETQAGPHYAPVLIGHLPVWHQKTVESQPLPQWVQTFSYTLFFTLILIWFGCRFWMRRNQCPFVFLCATILLSELTTFAAPSALLQNAQYANPVICAECHPNAYNDWEKSDHRRSMQHANDETILGDFANILFTHIGFDDLLDFSDETLVILLDDIFYSPQPPFPMRYYGTADRSAHSIFDGIIPIWYDTPGQKFKPPLDPQFEDFALACFDAKTGLTEKLRRAMNDSQRKDFDDETAYRKLLLVNRPCDISGAQARIVSRLQKLIAAKKIPNGALPTQCTTFRLFQDGKKFMVETDVGIVEILFTLGIRPLQQYLVETEGGRLQCLPIAWDSVDRRWFHLYPKEQIPKDDPLHWTKPLQNWNFMCADCHTTHFEKNFDSRNLTYRSTFTEINVGCQSCHGPYGNHVESARKNNLTAHMTGLSEGSPSVESCAACHTRRRLLRPGAKTPSEPLLDFIVPEMQDHTIYYADGQLLEEAFEVGSFMQSKMYSKGVGCTNCHESHSLQLKFSGNRLCTQCHAASVYDSVRHHFHADSSKPGTQCVECHLPQSVYMVADPRRDHSIRKPSPALTMLVHVPNSCMQCHQDRKKGETLQWAHEHVERWYGELRRSFVGYSATGPIADHYSLAIAAGQRGDPQALPLLASVIQNKSQRDYRDIIRASALSHFGRLVTPQFATAEQSALILESLEDRSPLVRLAAVETLFQYPAEIKLKYLPEKLTDPLLAIRLESVRALADVSDRLQGESKGAFESASKEYIDSCQVVNDQAASYLNYAVFEYNRESSRRRQVEAWFKATVQDVWQQEGPNAQKSFDEALRTRTEYIRRLTEKPLGLYNQSLRIDADFIPVRINLAMLHDERGESKEAEVQFREVLRIDPEQGDAAYSLGLLLAELNRWDEAAVLLKRAIELRPANARIRYNYGLLLMQQEKRLEAQKELESALKIEPMNISFLNALAILHLQLSNRTEAIKTTDRLIELEPTNPQWRLLRQRAEQK